LPEGTDASSDSAAITMTAHTAIDVTLTYDLYAPTDPVGHPSLGTSSVRFGWDGQRVVTEGELPSADWAASSSRRGTPAPPTPEVRPIIFIPGIEGSYLDDANGNEIWPAAQSTLDDDCIHIFLAYVDANCERQLFQPAAFLPNGQPPPGDPVDVANGVNHPLEQFPGGGNTQLDGTLATTWACVLDLFGACPSHWYDITAEMADDAGYTVPKSDDATGLSVCSSNRRCFVPIGIDFRRSANENAERVFSIIRQVLAVTGSDRVNILAHSQGGLIANALVHRPETVGKIYRVVTLGTPFLGAPKALAALLYQEPCIVDPHYFGCAADPAVIQELSKNYPGAAELLPSQAYYTMAPDSPLVSGSLSNGLAYGDAQSMIAALMVAPPLDSTPALIGAAQAFHSTTDLWSPLDDSVGLVRMIGYDANKGAGGCEAAPCASFQIGRYDPAGTIVSVDTQPGHQLYFGTGDGTVPLYSASVFNPSKGFDGRGRGHNVYWCGISHFGLAWSTPVWTASEAFLEGSSDYTTDQVGPGGGCPNGSIGSVAPLLGSAQ
jgi:pimeloyl-ACP methyl ester carboxylesterase